MLADASAAVRNSASRRVIGPVIGVLTTLRLEDQTAGAPWELREFNDFNLLPRGLGKACLIDLNGVSA
jgi:hypothetical protein